MTQRSPRTSARSSTASSRPSTSTIDATGQPIAWPVTPYYQPGGGLRRRHDRARLSEEGATTPSATRMSRCSSPTRPAAGSSEPPTVLVQGTARRRRPRPQGQLRSATSASGGEAPGAEREAAAGVHPQALLGLVLPAPLRARAARARLRLAGRRPRRPSRSCSTRTWRRSARATTRSPRRRRRRRAGGARDLGRAPRRARLARRPDGGAGASSRPDGFPFAMRLRRAA